MKRFSIYALALGAAAGMASFAGSEPVKDSPSAAHDMSSMSADVKTFNQVAVDYKGTKIWLPGTMIVKKGEKVRIQLINNIEAEPNTHGFAIDAYGIKSVVGRGKPETVEFTADKEGIFDVYCQLHPAHVGGQLLVLP